MADLDEDIARIAALRGVKPEAYVAQAHAPPRISYADLKAVVSIPDGFDPTRDLLFFDRLPPAVRAFIREQERPLVAAAVYRIWYEVRDESLVCQAIRHTLRRPK